MRRPRILIACVGNIFLGDDGFGVEVARRLARSGLPPEARVVDFGIRSLDLTYALLEASDVTIFVDATARSGDPGTVYLIEPDLSWLPEPEAAAVAVETHGMDLINVFGVVKSMGGRFGRILLVGCEPETLGPEPEGQMGLSEPVEAAVDEAVRLIVLLVDEILGERPDSVAAANTL